MSFEGVSRQIRRSDLNQNSLLTYRTVFCLTLRLYDPCQDWSIRLTRAFNQIIYRRVKVWNRIFGVEPKGWTCSFVIKAVPLTVKRLLCPHRHGWLERVSMERLIRGWGVQNVNDKGFTSLITSLLWNLLLLFSHTNERRRFKVL